MTDFVDRSVLAGTKRRESDGFMVADVRIARTGVQYYLGREVDKDNEHGFRDKRTVTIYRPGEEVFSDETIKSAAHRTVTNDHPKDKLVTSENWKKVAVGQTADEVSAEGIYIRVPLMVTDEAAIRDIENGKRELSAGYTSVLDWTPGKTPDGTPYDAVQREIRFNHVAIVQRGRAGSAVRIGDAASPIEDGEDEGAHTMEKTLKTVTVDGLSIETTDQGAQVIGKLQAQLDAATASSTKVLADHATALADRDKTIAAKDAEIDSLKKKVLSDADLDKLVTARADAVANARIVHKDVKTDGLSLPDIRKAAVVLALGDEAVKDKSAEYIDARFDILLEEAKKSKTGTKDTFRAALKDGAADVNDADKPVRSAYEKMIEDMATSSKRTVSTASA